MDPDMNKYDHNHRVSHHGTMSDADWEDAYRAAWLAFFTPDANKTIMRRDRAAAHRRPGTPRRDRRHGMPIENPFVFYTKYWGGTAVKLFKYARVYLRCKAMLDAALKAPDRWSYSDLAIAPPKTNEFDALDLYHATTGGEAALERKYREDAIRGRRTHNETT